MDERERERGGGCAPSSSSSNVRPFVSGTRKYMETKPTKFHPAYHPNAPVAVKAPMSGGKVMATTKLLDKRKIVSMIWMEVSVVVKRAYKNHSHAVDKDIPKSRTEDG